MVEAEQEQRKPVRIVACWACGSEVKQYGKGRPRLLCWDKGCCRKRRLHNMREASWLDKC